MSSKPQTPDQIERRRISRRKWVDNNKEIMDECRRRWRMNNLVRILRKRRERTERITGRKVIPRSLVTKETKLLNARARSTRWYHAHKEEIRDKDRARSYRYYHANKRKIKLTQEQKKYRNAWQKAWRARNRDKMRLYDIKSRENIQRSIKNRLRTRITGALRRNHIRKSSKTIDLIGCTWADFKLHIERQFPDGMSWENRSLWHIDHIKPCAKFDLTDPEQRKLCFHFTNMQPLWAADNLTKHKKWQEAA